MSTVLADDMLRASASLHSETTGTPPTAFAWLDLPEGHRVPPELWERAFRGPIRDFLSRPGKSFRARLVESIWGIVSGGDAMPPELPLLIEWIHSGSLIVDDIQDGSTHRRGAQTLHQRYGVPIALNTGNSLYFLPMVLLEQLQLLPEIELDLHRRICRTMLNCHRGQALDLEARIGSLPQSPIPDVVASISDLKTASLMELAAVVGPTAAASSPELIDAFACFGTRVGTALQMLNDLADLTGRHDPRKQYEDLRQGRVTWPWAWAAQVLDPVAFEELRDAAVNLNTHPGDAPRLAQQILSAVEGPARQVIHRLLDDSLQTLQHRLGSEASLATLSMELSHLESSYA